MPPVDAHGRGHQCRESTVPNYLSLIKSYETTVKIVNFLRSGFYKFNNRFNMLSYNLSL